AQRDPLDRALSRGRGAHQRSDRCADDACAAAPRAAAGARGFSGGAQPSSGGGRRMISFRDRRVMIAAAVVLLLIVVVVWRGCHKTAGEEEAGDVTASVQVVKAERGAIANEVTAVATLTPQRQADLMPKLSAQIVSMPLLVNR